jgi:uncharacterized protein YegJ (DUF2314 family)
MPAQADGDKEPLIALVMLLRDARAVDSQELAERATEALGVPIHDDQPNATDRFVAGEEPSFALKFGDYFFLINSFARPYMDNPEEAATEIPELRLRKAVREHRAWMSVDLLGQCPTVDQPEVYRTLGKLLAELIDDDCLALFAPATSQLIVYDPEMRDQLLSENPLDVFEQQPHPPVVPVSGDDPRLKAAVARARRRWPQFVRHFEQRRPEQSFSVKARIGNADAFEFMWLTVTGLEHGFIYGRLDNDPIELTTICCGDRVRVAVKELNDWLITDGPDMVGGFTIDVLRRIQEEMQRD